MSEINVTPLVDVMLVLLIIFMVTAPLLSAGVPVELPESRAKALAQEQKPVILTLERSGKLFIDQSEVAPGELADRLAALPRKPDGDTPQVTLRADKALDYGRVMAVMGELNRAGFNSIALVTSAAPVSGGSPEAP
jgi:biopolymer transport protein TolR